MTIGVREVDVTGRGLHHLLYVPTTFSNDVGMLRKGYVHLQSHLVYLLFTKSKVCILYSHLGETVWEFCFGYKLNNVLD